MEYLEACKRPEMVRKILDESGVVVIKNVLRDQAVKDRLSEEALKAFEDTVDVDSLNGTLVERFEMMRKMFAKSTGVLGSVKFGYLFRQPTDKYEKFKATLEDGEEIYFEKNAGFGVNRLAFHFIPELEYFLRAVQGDYFGSVLTQDSIKLFRGALTPLHFDTAPESFGRIQATVLGQFEGATRLCYITGSHHPEFHKEVASILDGLGMPPKRSNTTYCKIEPFFANYLQRKMELQGRVVYGEPGDLVIWKPGTFHYEAVVGAETSMPLPWAQERYQVGMHTPVGLEVNDVRFLDFMGVHGFIMDPYYQNRKSSRVIMNAFHMKKTMYSMRRTRSKGEKELFDMVIRDWEAYKESLSSDQSSSESREAESTTSEHHDQDGNVDQEAESVGVAVGVEKEKHFTVPLDMTLDEALSDACTEIQGVDFEICLADLE